MTKQDSNLDAATRLALLRKRLQGEKLDGFIVPHSDEYQNEFLPAYAERLAWLTGFTGSAGTAIIMQECAAIFVDSRYTIQAREQTDTALYEQRDLVLDPGTGFLSEHLKKNMRFGYDPRLHTVNGVETLRRSCERVGASLVAVKANPIDLIWHDQPEPPLTLTVPHELDFAGESHDAKRARIAQAIAQAKCDSLLITQTDSIAWLLNIRGADITYTPLTLCVAVLDAGGHVDLFIDDAKTSPELDAHLGNHITRHAPKAITKFLGKQKGKKVLLDPAVTPAFYRELLDEGGAKVMAATDPCQLPKAMKNQTEIAGMRRAHIRDGAALTRFLHWLDTKAVDEGATELSAATTLSDMRAQTEVLKALSFPVISATGPHGALPHYRVSEESDLPLKNGDIYLVDSGGQYLDGTTDVTRTIILGGKASPEQRDRFTRVLKGTINVARSKFPEGTKGSALDPIARRALWDAGLDFGHGTGHGVGAYLGVHEGPCNISSRSQEPLRPGMILSDEPGYYKEGHYGIRIENLVVVNQPQMVDGGDQPMLSFETITLAPIDRNLIEPSLLTPRERDWLNVYHARVRSTLSPLLPAEISSWLEKVTQPI